MQETQAELSPGRLAVLSLVKREGPVSADSLAEKLKLTAMAVRQHLAALADAGLAQFVEQARPRGRPVQLWSATLKANPYFADTHSALAADLILQMKKAFGEEGMDRILALRTAEQEKAYRAQTDAKHTLKAKLDALARLRTAEGYMAEVRKDEAGDWLFVENHCPVCAAARLCTGLCREELALFHRVLGTNIKVERLTHIIAGAGRCAYRVTTN